MAIDRPNVFSNNFNVNFKFYSNALEPSMTLERIKYLRINCVAGQMYLTSSANPNPINIVVLTAGGAGQDSIFEVSAPEGSVLNDVLITGVNSGGMAGQAYITYILG